MSWRLGQGLLALASAAGTLALAPVVWLIVGLATGVVVSRASTRSSYTSASH